MLLTEILVVTSRSVTVAVLCAPSEALVGLLKLKRQRLVPFDVGVSIDQEGKDPSLLLLAQTVIRLALLTASPPLWEVIKAISAEVPEDWWVRLPTDGAEQHDHFLYGSPSMRNEIVNSITPSKSMRTPSAFAR